ncbi:MAG: hypothetical protein WCN85_15045, partial [Burkholderiales bacterium]
MLHGLAQEVLRGHIDQPVFTAVNRQCLDATPALIQAPAGDKFTTPALIGDRVEPCEVNDLRNRFNTHRPEQIVDRLKRAVAKVRGRKIAAIKHIHPVAGGGPGRQLPKMRPGVLDIEVLGRIRQARQQSVEKLTGNTGIERRAELIVARQHQAPDLLQNERAKNIVIGIPKDGPLLAQHDPPNAGMGATGGIRPIEGGQRAQLLFRDPGLGP